MGRTECNRIINFEGQPRLVGQMVEVKVTEAYPHSLRGEVVVADQWATLSSTAGEANSRPTIARANR